MKNTTYLKSNILGDLSKDTFWKIGMAISIVLGVLIRISGIWKTPLAVDEFYFVKAVENVLKHGLPQYDTGGYYTRGILFQYILASVSVIWDTKVELSYRLITILFNLLAIPAIFKLSRKIAGSTIAYIVSILFCFSLWEIEFARFIRMYSLFQTIFIWYIYLLYLVIIENKTQLLKWVYLISFSSIFIYEGCVFLLVLNFLPFLLKQESRKLSYILISSLLIILEVIYVSIDFRHIGVENYLPPDLIVEAKSVGPILLPLILLQSFSSNPIWFVSFLVPLGVSLFITYKLFKNTTIEKSTKLSLALLLLLSLLNLFALVIALFILFVLFQWITNKDLNLKKLSGFIIAGVVTFIFWFGYVFISDGWMIYFKSTQFSPLQYSTLSQLQLHNINQLSTHFSLKKAVFLFFNYPHFYDAIIEQFLEAIPIYFILSALFVTGYLILFYKENNKIENPKFNSSAFLISIVLLMAVGISSLNVPYNTTRYSFFFFPLVVIIIVHSMFKLSFMAFNRKTFSLSLFVLMLIGFTVLAEDFNMNHLLHSGSEQIYLRMNYKEKLAGHYYSRSDVITPAEFVNTHRKDEDIVLTTVIQTENYLNKLDYFYLDFNSDRLLIMSSEQGKKEVWTNVNLLYKETDFFDVIENNLTDVWIIINTPEDKDGSLEFKIQEIYKDNLVYKSFDKKINVFKITKN